MKKTSMKNPSVIEKLAGSLGRRDEAPNQKLAIEIVASEDREAVKELVENLSNKEKSIQNDCIKVLYEVGERAPELISPYYQAFGEALESKNNRMVWGAMTALDTIALVNPKGVYSLLAKISEATEKGSVITKDHGVAIFAKLASVSNEYSRSVFPILIEQLRKCPAKQLPQYAEKAMLAVSESNKLSFLDTLKLRFSELGNESQRQRIRKVLKKFNASI